ncbi:putative protein tyrosine phosphatase [Prosthecobacter fusiformis]|uniref:Tyrosine specific protein phosphatases domain-containing protein n=1 Tax=Prosthecobacter fusiformis TaxID=48464 RepID=A0A4R7S0X1_9BACT|nr:hypothetical protein [Prosthecobacter fusiformis]TDU71038.1 putative protein tyrosine phosphatase [Prosthecobacter fusiformis]
MFIERLQRELAICSAIQIGPFLAREPDRWHVVSIHDPIQAEADLAKAKSALQLSFEDALPTPGDDTPGPKPAHLQSFLAFAGSTAHEPLVLQCWAGRSRSTAMALVLIVKELHAQGLTGSELVTTSVDILLSLRPNANPNRFVLRLGLDQFLPPEIAQKLSTALIREPRLKANFL